MALKSVMYDKFVTIKLETFRILMSEYIFSENIKIILNLLLKMIGNKIETKRNNFFPVLIMI